MATVLAGLDRSVIIPQTKWINLERAKRELQLPEPWSQLIERGFHQDLVDRAYAHLMYCKKFGGFENACLVLAVIGDGFFTPFDRAQFEPDHNDPQFELKTNALNAIVEMVDFYGDRISAVVWKSLAHLACRTNPEVEQSIIKEAASGTLPYHYTLVDSALHATGLVYTFLMHVNSIMFRHTGRVLVHNCDCKCSLVNLEMLNGCIEYELPQANITVASQSVLTHLLAETFKLMECFLPFAYSITPEACQIQELMG